MTDAPATLADMLGTAWQRLSRGVADRKAPARHPTLATIGLDGAPRMRTVVLRAADRSAARLDIHTDALSGKVAEITTRADAALHVWDDKAKLQMRLRGQARILREAEAESAWADMPTEARGNYGPVPAPGVELHAPDAYHRQPSRDRFAIVALSLTEVELLHLGEAGHRRALFRAEDGWQGTWLSP